jgi:hypothetical protein
MVDHDPTGHVVPSGSVNWGGICDRDVVVAEADHGSVSLALSTSSLQTHRMRPQCHIRGGHPCLIPRRAVSGASPSGRPMAVSRRYIKMPYLIDIDPPSHGGHVTVVLSSPGTRVSLTRTSP